MARSTNRGLVVLILAMVAGALWFRFRGGRDDASPIDAPKPFVTTDAVVGVIDAATRPDPVVDPDSAVSVPEIASSPWQLQLSSDGKHALLTTGQSQAEKPTAYRAVNVDTHAVEGEAMLGGWTYQRKQVEGEPEPEHPFDASDLTRVAAIARSFPLGAVLEFASTADGTRGAFNKADDLYPFKGETIGTKVQNVAAYHPKILPDGKTLMFEGYDGQTDGPGTGKYSLFAVSLDGGRPQKVAGTDGIWSWALSRGGDTLRILVSQAPKIPTCALEIPLVKPFKVTRKRCLDGGVATLSPSGDWLAWKVGPEHDADGNPRPGTTRIRTLELATGNGGTDQMLEGDPLISDTGRLLVIDYGLESRFHDIVGTTVRKLVLKGISIGCGFRDDSELVCPSGDNVVVIDIAKLPAAR